MHSEGYCTWFVCLCVCLSPLILTLQGPSRLISDTNSSSATRARKVVAILLKRWRSRDMVLKQVTKSPTSTDATDSGSVEHWQFYDGEARVLER